MNFHWWDNKVLSTYLSICYNHYHSNGFNKSNYLIDLDNANKSDGIGDNLKMVAAVTSCDFKLDGIVEIHVGVHGGQLNHRGTTWQCLLHGGSKRPSDKRGRVVILIGDGDHRNRLSYRNKDLRLYVIGG